MGATWHYTEAMAFSGNVFFLKTWVEKDTVINGIACKKFLRNKQLFCDNQNEIEYAFERNVSVFLYMPEFNDFKLFYDFNMSAGDTLLFPLRDASFFPELDTFRVIVDSVETRVINGQTLKVQFVRYELIGEHWTSTRSDMAIEKIGFFNNLFYYYREFAGSCDGNFSRGLRCYEDSVLGLFETGIADSCNQRRRGNTSLEEIALGKELVVYPNPILNGSFLNIPILENQTELELSLYSPIGQLIFKRVECGSGGIEIPSHLPKGQYRIVIRYEGKLLQSSSLLVLNP